MRRSVKPMGKSPKVGTSPKMPNARRKSTSTSPETGRVKPRQIKEARKKSGSN